MYLNFVSENFLVIALFGIYCHVVYNLVLTLIIVVSVTIIIVKLLLEIKKLIFDFFNFLKKKFFYYIFLLKQYNTTYLIVYFIFTIIGMFLNTYYGDVLYCMGSAEEEEIQETIKFFQDEVYGTKATLHDVGLNVDNSSLSQEQIKEKNKILEVIKESEDAVKHNISQLKALRLAEEKPNISDGSASQESGKRNFSESSVNNPNIDFKRK